MAVLAWPSYQIFVYKHLSLSEGGPLHVFTGEDIGAEVRELSVDDDVLGRGLPTGKGEGVMAESCLSEIWEVQTEAAKGQGWSYI